MVDVLHNVCQFFSHESCGQCTPCREGTGWMLKITERLRRGKGRREDLDILVDVADRIGIMPGTTICGLSDGAGWPVKTAIRKFRGGVRGGDPEGREDRTDEAVEVGCGTLTGGTAVTRFRCDYCSPSSRSPGAGLQAEEGDGPAVHRGDGGRAEHQLPPRPGHAGGTPSGPASRGAALNDFHQLKTFVATYETENGRMPGKDDLRAYLRGDGQSLLKKIDDGAILASPATRASRRCGPTRWTPTPPAGSCWPAGRSSGRRPTR